MLDDVASPYDPPESRKVSVEPRAAHSRLGIASCVVGVTALLCFVGVFVVARNELKTSHGALPSDDQVTLIGYATMGGLGLLLLGGVLGLVGLLRGHVRTTFALIGVSLNGFILALMATIIAFGYSRAF